MRSYEDLINDERAIGKKLAANPFFRSLYELLMEEQNQIAMVEASGVGKPAIEACVRQIEEYVAAHPESGIDLSDNHTKQSLGRVVKYILEPFGYVPDKKRVISKKSGSNSITSGTIYKLKKQPKLIIEKRIVPVDYKNINS